MNQGQTFLHSTSPNYISGYDIRFRMVEPKKGEVYNGRKENLNTLLFLVKGEVEFSYNEFTHRSFTKGDLFFIPQASFIHGRAIEDSRILVLTFNNQLHSLYDNSTLLQYTELVSPKKYDFTPLPIHPLLSSFISSVETYIKKGLGYDYLHQLKQKELFILLQHCYDKEQIIKFFYPILGTGNFHSWVLENYKPDTTMSELAAQCNMTPKSFSRKFSEKFGMTFRNWVLQQKVRHIQLRLSIPDTSLKDIIREFNFYSLSHLNRFCKENYGESPSVLLKSSRGKISDK